MSVDATARLIYGIFNSEKNAPLFQFLMETAEYDPEEEHNLFDQFDDIGFEEIRRDIQKKFHVEFERIGDDADLDVIIGFSASCGRKGFDSLELGPDVFSKQGEYWQNIMLVLISLGVEEPEKYSPQWVLLSYFS